MSTEIEQVCLFCVYARQSSNVSRCAGSVEQTHKLVSQKFSDGFVRFFLSHQQKSAAKIFVSLFLWMLSARLFQCYFVRRSPLRENFSAVFSRVVAETHPVSSQKVKMGVMPYVLILELCWCRVFLVGKRADLQPLEILRCGLLRLPRERWKDEHGQTECLGFNLTSTALIPS